MGRRLASQGQDPGPGTEDTTSARSPEGVRRSSDESMNTEEIRRNTGDPNSWVGNDPTQAPRGDEAVRTGVGEVHSSKEPSNERVALHLNRRQWPFTALNSWTGRRSAAFNSRMELHLNRRQPRFFEFAGPG